MAEAPSARGAAAARPEVGERIAVGLSDVEHWPYPLLDVFAQHRQLEIKALKTTADRYAAAQRTLDALIAQQRSQQSELLAQRKKIETRLAELRSPPTP